ncbi:dTMP kinase [Xylella taiwanensis]|uniref:Thymidylate kinase n=1 Tax=Xylella taiwanensis TaxID=1444770 RepID=Z9JKY0_9GAMM|nr:dTMP kinase [Xylella taiwanensis]AXI84060.1 thymidylate kinase [Xylella taiwanensis]EWS79020.1 thymidylate kinase [Xylella taiwanensis]MCD8457174.1 dTMP kinase [Xylella taiwanensis]MCD8459583.1 dTMP kinase [Xylella taiwanensis]MCD8461550.1 dTMP kinase [Xylella taiwanensis]
MHDQIIPGGMLVAIEGIDGAGKTTLAQTLAVTLRRAGFETVISKEPTNGPWGTLLRQSASTGRFSPEHEVDLLLRDRRQHVEDLIIPVLARGSVVILDRYFPSMVAYQGAAGLPVDALLEANAFAPRPHLLLLLDVPPAIGLQRIWERGNTPNHFETMENLARCRDIFLALELPAKRVIDATSNAQTVLCTALAWVTEVLRARLGTSGAVVLERVAGWGV